FGRSIRESNCDCDRSMDASLLQTVYLQNDQAVLTVLGGGKDTWIDQISVKGPGKLSDGSDPSKLDVGRELGRLQARLEKAKKDGNDKQIAQIEERIAQLDKAGQVKKDLAPNPGQIALDTLSLIRQSYLR